MQTALLQAVMCACREPWRFTVRLLGSASKQMSEAEDSAAFPHGVQNHSDPARLSHSFTLPFTGTSYK